MTEHSSKERALIKFGSPGGDEHASRVARLHALYDVVVVNSGSIARGKELWGKIPHRPDEEEPSLQSYATLGSAESFARFQQSLLEEGLLAGQVLVTHHDIDVAEAAVPAQETNKLKKLLEENLAKGVISIINENDALSDEEITAWKYGGDNDGLARHTAQLLGASSLLLMTGGEGVEGLMESRGKAVASVDFSNIDHALHIAKEAAIETDGEVGRGGILSKVTAAWEAAESGIDAYIANSYADPLDVIEGRCGTYFPAHRG